MKWGSEFKRSGGIETMEILGRDDNGYFVYAMKINEPYDPYFEKFERFVNIWDIPVEDVYLERYDNNNNLQWTNKLAVPASDGRKLSFESIMYLDGKLLLFSSYYDKKLDKNFAYVNTITRDGKVNDDRKEIDAIQAGKKKNAERFDFVLSHDRSHVLIYHNEPGEKNEQGKFSVKVLTPDLQIAWKKIITTPYTQELFWFSDFTVSDGKVYMLSRIQDDKREKKDGLPTYRYAILSYTEDDSKPREYIVSLDDKFISEISFEVNEDNNLVCAGFYSAYNSHSIGGAFCLIIDSKTKRVLVKSVKDIDGETFPHFVGTDRAIKRKELVYYNLRRLMPKSGGGSVLVAEHFLEQEATHTDISTGEKIEAFYSCYDGILLVNINENGEIGWVTHIPKRQTTGDMGYHSSFAMGIHENKIWIVYNDNRKNLTRPGEDIEPMDDLDKAEVILVTVDANTGEYKKSSLFSLKGRDTWLRPKIHLQTGPDEMVIYSTLGKKYMFGTLKLD
jgi:hypothetical protein